MEKGEGKENSEKVKDLDGGKKVQTKTAENKEGCLKQNQNKEMEKEGGKENSVVEQGLQLGEKEAEKLEDLSEEEDSEESDSEESDTDSEESELDALREKLEKKDLIINEQLKEIQEKAKEIRQLRLDERTKDAEISRVTSIVIAKEELLLKMNRKIAELGTRDLKKLDKKVVKKTDQTTQTEEREEKPKASVPDYGILDKLPGFGSKNSVEEKKGKSLLNINIKRGVSDPCFRCRDLDVVVENMKKNNNKLKEEVKRYQEKLREVKESASEKKAKEIVNKEIKMYNEMKKYQGNLGTCTAEASGDEKKQSTDQTESADNLEEETVTEEVDQVQEQEGQEIEQEKKTTALERTREGEEVETERSENEDNMTKDEIELNIEEEIEEIRNNDKRSSERKPDTPIEKDKSKLCNSYVLKGMCRRDRCKFTHKELCREIVEKGECKKQECEQGHDISGICRRYNSNSGCNMWPRRCHFLHIKIRNNNREDQNERERSRDRDRREDKRDKAKGNERKIEDDREKRRNNDDRRSTRGGSERWETKNPKDRESRRGEPERSANDNANKHRGTNLGQIDRERDKEKAQTQENDQRAKLQQMKESRNVTPDGERSLRDYFLKMGRKHNVWKEKSQKRFKTWREKRN